jgi:hypothetical protein
MALNLKEKKGVMSGKIALDGNSVGFSGKATAGGEWTIPILRSAKFGKTNLTLKVSVNLGDPTLDQVAGTLSSDDEAWTAHVLTDKALFSLLVPETTYAGTYTMLIPTDTNAPVAGPGGAGYASITNQADGNIKILAGALGDGVKLSGKVPISKNGDWPFYAPLYKNASKIPTGSIIGWLQFTNAAPAGTVSWIKTTNVVGVLTYPNGFTNVVPVAGSPYAPPGPGDLPIDFTLGTFLATEGTLDAPRSNEVSVTALKLLPTNTTNKLVIAIKKANGVVSGTFQTDPLNTLTKKKFSGVVLQNTTNAAGHFPDGALSGKITLSGN